MPADAGIRFGQYVLVRRIARGGMAEVFLAQQRGLEGFDRRVAVKRILPHLADSPDFVKMFLSEARLAAQLAHPNVVHIYEFGKVEHDYFIAMEFVDGVHAGQLFKHGEKERIPATLVARIGADAANALHYAHELRGPTGKLYGLVHRDVSPANIMVSYDGVVKLCDFGIAKAALAGDQLTNPGQVKGKYAYMSPEQTIAAPLDGRSDVFSLAIVLWELLAGRYIVSRGDAVAAMRAIRDGKLDPIEKVAPAIPAQLAKAINWALEPKREKRATAADFALALEAFIKQAPELATSMQLGGWIRGRFTREGTGQVAALNPPTGSQNNAQNTQFSPGTVAGPGTVGGTNAAESAQIPVTPAVYPPRRVVKLVEDSNEGTEIYSASDLEAEAAQTIKGARPPAITPGAQTMIERTNRAVEEATLRAGPPMMVGDETEVLDSRHFPPAPDEEDSENHFETILQDRRTPIPSGPTVVPTQLIQQLESGAVPPSGMQSMLGSGAHAMHGSGPQSAPTTPRAGSALPHTLRGTGPRRMFSGNDTGRPRTQGSQEQARRRRKVIAIGGLGGLMLVSFLIALAASGGKTAATTVAQDAGVMMQTDAALPIAPPPLDATIVPQPTIPIDAGPEAGAAYLVVRTIPDGGTIKVGDQSRVATVQPGDPTGAATAQLVLEAGRHMVIAQLDGYQPEKREVILERGDSQKIEITFTRKIVVRPDRGPAMGRLTVRTTPWSDVFLGNKKLGQAPFADLELPVGTHTLTFKNPSRPTVTKTVKILAGKPVKLNFNLP